MKLLHTIAIFVSFYLPHPAQRIIDLPRGHDVVFKTTWTYPRSWWQVKYPVIIINGAGECFGSWTDASMTHGYPIYCPHWALDFIQRTLPNR